MTRAQVRLPVWAQEGRGVRPLATWALSKLVARALRECAVAVQQDSTGAQRLVSYIVAVQEPGPPRASFATS